MTASYTNPTPVSTTPYSVVNATITYEVDGVLQTVTAAETLSLNIAPTTTKKIWTSTNVLNTLFTIVNVTGDGATVFDTSGKLVFNVTAPNDATAHILKFKLKLKAIPWLAQIPFIRNWLGNKLVFVG